MYTVVNALLLVPVKVWSTGLLGRRTFVRRMESSSSARQEDATVESSEWNVAESSLDRTSEDTSTCRETENVMTVCLSDSSDKPGNSPQGHMIQGNPLIYTCCYHQDYRDDVYANELGIDRNDAGGNVPSR